MLFYILIYINIKKFLCKRDGTMKLMKRIKS